MVSIPLYLLLFLYFLFLAVFAGFMIINLYHLAITGSVTFVSFVATVIVFGMAAFVIFTTWHMLNGTSWQTMVPLFDFGGSNWNSLE